MNLGRTSDASARKKRRTSDGTRPAQPSPSSASSTTHSPVTPANRRPTAPRSNQPMSSSSKPKPTSTTPKVDPKRPRFFSPPRAPALGRAQSADPLEGDVFDADQDPIGMDDLEQTIDHAQVKEEEAEVRESLDERLDLQNGSSLRDGSASDVDADDEDAGGSDYDGGPAQNISPTGTRPTTRRTRAVHPAEGITLDRPPAGPSNLANGSSAKKKRRSGAHAALPESESEAESPARLIPAPPKRIPPRRPSTTAASPTTAATTTATPRKTSASGQAGSSKAGSGGSGAKAPRSAEPKNAAPEKAAASSKSSKAKQDVEMQARERELKIRRDAAILDLGLRDVWEDLDTSLDALLESAIAGFTQRISDRIVVAMSYPPVTLKSDDPSLAKFLRPFLENLRPAVLSALVARLPEIERRRIPPPPPANNAAAATYFYDRDYEELVYGPVYVLLTRTTGTLQQTALDEVLASFPAILGDQPKEELRVLVDKRAVHVMAKVKEGVKLLLEQEMRS